MDVGDNKEMMETASSNISNTNTQTAVGNNNVAMFQRAKVIIQNPNVKRKGYICRALLDAGSQLTCVTKKL